MTTPNQSTTLAQYMKKPEVLTKFSDVVGDSNARPYIQSVLIAVSASPELMKCTNDSILRAALRAASLGLSCDPALKQAWIVPYNKKANDGWVKEAQFQPHYKGLYTLAMRTGKYWQINVSPIYDGQRVLENSLTGLHVVQEQNGFVGEQPGRNAGYHDVTVRRRKDQRVIGWLGYFKTKKGFEKSVWMSCEEIDDHARKYVRDYDKNPNWNDPDKRSVMEMKTVLRSLLSWADMSGTENLQLTEALAADSVTDEIVDAEAIESAPASPTYEQAEKTIVNTQRGERFLTELDAETLNSIYLSATTQEDVKELIAIVLKKDYGMEKPEQPQKTQQNMKELGF